MRLAPPKGVVAKELPDDHSECEPPDPISNSEVKVLSADGSVGSPHVRVGHCQASKRRKIPALARARGFFLSRKNAFVNVDFCAVVLISPAISIFLPSIVPCGGIFFYSKILALDS